MSKKILITLGCVGGMVCIAALLFLTGQSKEYTEGYKKGRNTPLSVACNVREEAERVTTLQTLIGVPREEAKKSALLQLKNSILTEVKNEEDKAVGFYDGLIIRMREC